MAEELPGGSDRQVALQVASGVVVAMLAAGRIPDDPMAYTLRNADKFLAWLRTGER